MANKHAVLSLSGGMDSSSLLATLLWSDYDFIHCFAFDYGQRHDIELQCAKNLTDFLINKGFKVSFEIIDLKSVFSLSQSALNPKSNLEVPKEEYNEINLRDTVVENRNVIFSSIIYSKALSISKLFDCDVHIALGVHNSDESVYPDCRPQSVNMARELYKISNYGSERIDYITPFILDNKTEVLGKGLKTLEKLRIDFKEFYSYTSSCYDPNAEGACGTCATCRDRLSAFRHYDIQDPIVYRIET